jgi:LysR family transcriptional activator of nhaA
MGAFPATAWSREDLTRRQGLKLLGPSPEVSEQFFAISAERKVQDPLVQMTLTQRIE